MLPESKTQEIAARAHQLSSLRVLYYHQVAQLIGSLNWASGLIPLGRLYLRPLQRYFHSLGLTDRFMPPRRSDPSVLCQLTPALAGKVFSHLWNPYPSFPGGFYDFHGRLDSGLGRPHGDSQISGTWAPLDRQLHINCLELKVVEAAVHHWAPVLQDHQVMIATDN